MIIFLKIKSLNGFIEKQRNKKKKKINNENKENFKSKWKIIWINKDIIIILYFINE